VTEKIIRVLKERPLFFFKYVRTHLLFQRTRFLIRLLRMLKIYPESIQIGIGTRVQRLGCLLLEMPSSSIHVGKHGIIYENAKIEAYGEGKLQIGDFSVIGDARIYCRAKVQIGDRFLTSWNVLIQDYDPHPIDPRLRGKQVEGMCGFTNGIPEWAFPSDPVWIGDDVWLGANVTILKGVRIGSGSIVAANSVVSAGDYPARSLLAGAPAKIIKLIEAES
jgi:acetyltransferase-like isoleucine patch superfamily enzyme